MFFKVPASIGDCQEVSLETLVKIRENVFKENIIIIISIMC